MKLILYVVLCLQCIDLVAITSASRKPKRHDRILQKKVKRLGLRNSGQIWPDRYGYDPKLPSA